MDTSGRLDERSILNILGEKAIYHLSSSFHDLNNTDFESSEEIASYKSLTSGESVNEKLESEIKEDTKHMNGEFNAFFGEGQNVNKTEAHGFSSFATPNYSTSLEEKNFTFAYLFLADLLNTKIESWPGRSKLPWSKINVYLRQLGSAIYDKLPTSTEKNLYAKKFESNLMSDIREYNEPSVRSKDPNRLSIFTKRVTQRIHENTVVDYFKENETNILDFVPWHMIASSQQRSLIFEKDLGIHKIYNLGFMIETDNGGYTMVDSPTDSVTPKNHPLQHFYASYVATSKRHNSRLFELIHIGVFRIYAKCNTLSSNFSLIFDHTMHNVAMIETYMNRYCHLCILKTPKDKEKTVPKISFHVILNPSMYMSELNLNANLVDLSEAEEIENNLDYVLTTADVTTKSLLPKKKALKKNLKEFGKDSPTVIVQSIQAFLNENRLYKNLFNANTYGKNQFSNLKTRIKRLEEVLCQELQNVFDKNHSYLSQSDDSLFTIEGFTTTLLPMMPIIIKTPLDFKMERLKKSDINVPPASSILKKYRERLVSTKENDKEISIDGSSINLTSSLGPRALVYEPPNIGLPHFIRWKLWEGVAGYNSSVPQKLYYLSLKEHVGLQNDQSLPLPMYGYIDDLKNYFEESNETLLSKITHIHNNSLNLESSSNDNNDNDDEEIQNNIKLKSRIKNLSRKEISILFTLANLLSQHTNENFDLWEFSYYKDKEAEFATDASEKFWYMSQYYLAKICSILQIWRQGVHPLFYDYSKNINDFTKDIAEIKLESIQKINKFSMMGGKNLVDFFASRSSIPLWYDISDELQLSIKEENKAFKNVVDERQREQEKLEKKNWIYLRKALEFVWPIKKDQVIKTQLPAEQKILRDKDQSGDKTSTSSSSSSSSSPTSNVTMTLDFIELLIDASTLCGFFKNFVLLNHGYIGNENQLFYFGQTETESVDYMISFWNELASAQNSSAIVSPWKGNLERFYREFRDSKDILSSPLVDISPMMARWKFIKKEKKNDTKGKSKTGSILLKDMKYKSRNIRHTYSSFYPQSRTVNQDDTSKIEDKNMLGNLNRFYSSVLPGSTMNDDSTENSVWHQSMYIGKDYLDPYNSKIERSIGNGLALFIKPKISTENNLLRRVMMAQFNMINDGILSPIFYLYPGLEFYRRHTNLDTETDKDKLWTLMTYHTLNTIGKILMSKSELYPAHVVILDGGDQEDSLELSEIIPNLMKRLSKMENNIKIPALVNNVISEHHFTLSDLLPSHPNVGINMNQNLTIVKVSLKDDKNVFNAPFPMTLLDFIGNDKTTDGDPKRTLEFSKSSLIESNNNDFNFKMFSQHTERRTYFDIACCTLPQFLIHGSAHYALTNKNVWNSDLESANAPFKQFIHNLSHTLDSTLHALQHDFINPQLIVSQYDNIANIPHILTMTNNRRLIWEGGIDIDKIFLGNCSTGFYETSSSIILNGGLGKRQINLRSGVTKKSHIDFLFYMDASSHRQYHHFLELEKKDESSSDLSKSIRDYISGVIDVNNRFDIRNLPNQNDSSKIPSFYHLSSYVDVTRDNIKRRSMIPIYTFDRPRYSSRILQPPFLFYKTSDEGSFFNPENSSELHDRNLLKTYGSVLFNENMETNDGAALFYMMKLIAALWVVCMTAKMGALRIYKPLDILKLACSKWFLEHEGNNPDGPVSGNIVINRDTYDLFEPEFTGVSSLISGEVSDINGSSSSEVLSFSNNTNESNLISLQQAFSYIYEIPNMYRVHVGHILGKGENLFIENNNSVVSRRTRSLQKYNILDIVPLENSTRDISQYYTLVTPRNVRMTDNTIQKVYPIVGKDNAENELLAFGALEAISRIDLVNNFHAISLHQKKIVNRDFLDSISIHEKEEVAKTMAFFNLDPNTKIDFNKIKDEKETKYIFDEVAALNSDASKEFKSKSTDTNREIQSSVSIQLSEETEKLKKKFNQQKNEGEMFSVSSILYSTFDVDTKISNYGVIDSVRKDSFNVIYFLLNLLEHGGTRKTRELDTGAGLTANKLLNGDRAFIKDLLDESINMTDGDGLNLFPSKMFETSYLDEMISDQ